ncbi:class I SAM-dependent methyltransferase [Streptomyces halobius]|uniref:Class I SAM-dependent methyltransferase n=1 Tax=Streptomyces halobius TaxID=2879846 RepID=A0ABY4M7K1_9ACTN|nr:class I SAM-dependent methyltransferase [Streptomyces halobius]UQA92246.1 class I SAM-dependent methyltransferase [Streptomyces halobius]
MNASSQYLQAWEGFWGDAPTGEGEVFWDSDPTLTVQSHLASFEEHFDAGLPVVDLGCGNGTQTRFLAGRYAPVLGVDLSAAAIGLARAADEKSVAAYRQLDAADADTMHALHEELGDAHIYMRGVLHQCAPEDRARIAANIAGLLGTRGRIFAVEPAQAVKEVLMSLVQDPGGAPPKLVAVISHGLAPAEMADSELPELMRECGLRVIGEGQLPLATTEFDRRDGARIELPSNWVVAGR